MKAVLAITPIMNVDNQNCVIDKQLVECIVLKWDKTTIMHNENSDPKIFETKVSRLSIHDHIVWGSIIQCIVAMTSSDDNDVLERFCQRYTPQSIKDFMVIVNHRKSGDCKSVKTIKGETLLQALINHYNTVGKFLWFERDDYGEGLEDNEYVGIMLESIENETFPDFDSYSISILDNTDPEFPVFIYPVECRTDKFSQELIGQKIYIQCWIPAEVEEDELITFDSVHDARQELNQLEEMQPENIYRIEFE